VESEPLKPVVTVWYKQYMCNFGYCTMITKKKATFLSVQSVLIEFRCVKSVVGIFSIRIDVVLVLLGEMHDVAGLLVCID